MSAAVEIKVKWFKRDGGTSLQPIEAPRLTAPRDIVPVTKSEAILTSLVAENGHLFFSPSIALAKADPMGEGGSDIEWAAESERWICEMKAKWVTSAVVGQAMGYYLSRLVRNQDLGCKERCHVLSGGFRVNHEAIRFADLLAKVGISIVLFEIAAVRRKLSEIRLRVYQFDGRGTVTQVREGEVFYDPVNVNWAGHTGFIRVKHRYASGGGQVEIVKKSKSGSWIPATGLKESDFLSQALHPTTFVHMEPVAD